MNSSKSTLLVAIFAVLGVIAFSIMAFPPSVAFLIGVIGASLIFIFTTNKQNGETPASEQTTTTLYVGNLPYKANETHVKELFSEYGEVFAVRLMKDKKTGKRRGFGFVVIAEANAQNAIASLNEFDYQGRTLKVRVANDPKDQAQDRV